MPETINPNPIASEAATQPPLFAPDGSPSPEVIKALKQIEEEKNREYQNKINEEVAERAEERRINHAP